MGRIVLAWVTIALLMLAAAPGLLRSAQSPSPSATTPVALLIQVDGAISPASADYVVRGLEHAAEENAAVVVLQMDTPGGLDTSMRDIIKAVLSSPVPVAGFVAPDGSRAASAGTYILYACHIAAMAPATNLGAATPVQLGAPSSPVPVPNAKQDKEAPTNADAETRKTINDAVSYIRALAEKRGRNADWAEQAVRNAASLPANQALEQHVIDLIANNVPDLLAKIDGRTVTTAAGERVLHTRGIAIQSWKPDWRTRFLSVIANPSLAYLLLLIGIGGLLFEAYSPGVILPGVAGAICLLLALYAFQLLPVNYAGLALMALGIVLIVAETFVPAYGTLGIGGVIAFVTGSVVFMDTGIPGYGIALPLLIGISLSAALLVVGIIWLALRARNRPVVSGREQMIGSIATVLGDFDSRGSVHVHGERWQARTNTPLHAGQPVRVDGIDGLVLTVSPVGSNVKGES